MVRSVLGWALRVVESHEAGPGNALPGPRLAQVRLGQLMSRSESETLIGLIEHIRAEELAQGLEPGKLDEELVAEIRGGWGQVLSPRYRAIMESRTLTMANDFCLAIRRHVRGDELKLLELGARLRTWKSLEDHFRGRDWQSIRDDFERHALRIYRAEKKITCDTSDFVVEVDKMRGTRR